MSETLLVVANTPISVGLALTAFAAVLFLVLLTLVIVVARSAGARSRDADQQADRTEDLEARLAEMARAQVEAIGRAQAMGEGLAARQSELARLVNERLDAVSGRIGQSMEATTKQTVERLQHLHERLAVIVAGHLAA
jgi:DNA recombination protein RmuC